MHIILENGSYILRNMGDVAMLQVAVSRLRALWPDARLSVITYDPEGLARLVPGTEPLSAEGPRMYFSEGAVLGRVGTIVPEVETLIRDSSFTLAARCARQRVRLRAPKLLPDLDEFVRTVRASDLVMACGGGYVNDISNCVPRRSMELLHLAAMLGKPIAMTGHGLGPLGPSSMRRVCQKMFPKLRLLTLREGVLGPTLSRELGTESDRVVVTGDDAIELTRDVVPNEAAGAIGLAVRRADYAKVDTSTLDQLRETLNPTARELGAPQLAVPISNFKEEDDAGVISSVIGGRLPERPSVPEDVIRQVQRCRVVVSGTYHAGVFALSCGVPVVSFASSDYYRAKFRGLAAQFGTGCVTLDTNDRNFPELLREGIQRLWDTRDGLIDPLRRAALQQADAGSCAYERLRECVD